MTCSQNFPLHEILETNSVKILKNLIFRNHFLKKKFEMASIPGPILYDILFNTPKFKMYSYIRRLNDKIIMIISNSKQK